MENDFLEFEISTKLNDANSDIDDVMLTLYAVLGMLGEHDQNDNVERLKDNVRQSLSSLHLTQQIIANSHTELN